MQITVPTGKDRGSAAVSVPSTPVTALTLRELIVALARTEEELRGLRDPGRVCAPIEGQTQRREDTVAIQRQIIRELRLRRHAHRGARAV